MSAIGVALLVLTGLAVLGSLLRGGKSTNSIPSGPPVSPVLDRINTAVARERALREGLRDLDLAIHAERLWVDAAVDSARRASEKEAFLGQDDERRRAYKAQRAALEVATSMLDRETETLPRQLTIYSSPAGLSWPDHADPAIAQTLRERAAAALVQRERWLTKELERVHPDPVMRDAFWAALHDGSQTLIIAGVRTFARRHRLLYEPEPPALPTLSLQTPLVSPSVADRVRERRVPYLVHFTRAENVPAIMRDGLCPVALLEARGRAFARNDWQRLDGHLGATSLSISHPNERLFYRWRSVDSRSRWAVLLLSPTILSSHRCAFFERNAAGIRMRGELKERESTAGFEAMFGMIDGADTREVQRLLPCDPTDVQAEVLVFERIEPSLIESCVFNDQVTLATMRGVLGNRHSSFCPDRTGLFGLRSYHRCASGSR